MAITALRTTLRPAAHSMQKPANEQVAHLPCSKVHEYRKGQLIYSQDHSSSGLYLVISGNVISRMTLDGREVVVDIYHQNEFFGESAFLGLPECCEQVTALKNTQLMTWNISEVERLMIERPSL